jgi:CMP/dCMP kinase
MSKINIAIDGFAGCGKSTTAKRVAACLNYTYIDSGAMYRAVTLYFLRHGIDFSSESPEMKAALDDIHLEFVSTPDGSGREMHLNGESVEEAIRTPEVSDAVSPVSVHPMVRRAMVSQQQRMGEQKGVVMDGRDIGTVVFPDAELKVFMTADMQVRARRRQEELARKGIEWDIAHVIENLSERDRIDSTRKEGPLRKAGDAIEIDTTFIEIDEQVDQVCELAREKTR